MDFDSKDAVAADQTTTTTPAAGEQPFQFDSAGATEASIGNEFKRGISAGIDSAQGALYGLAGMAGDAAGLDGVRDWGLAGYQRNQAEGAENAPAVGTYRSVGGLHDAALYAAGGLGSLVPFAATSLASAGTGGLVAAGAKVAARKGVERFAQSRLAQGVAAAAGRLPSAATGAKIGAVANSIGTEQGLIYGDIHEKTGEYAPGTAAVYGAAAGALDVLPELRLAGKILNRGGKAATERFVPGLAKQMGLEGSTEVGQTALENLAVQDVDPNQRAFEGDNLHQMVDAGIIGALGGGAAHTIGHGYTRIAGVPEPVPDGPLARAATVAAPAVPGLPAPERLGLPSPDTLYTGEDGQTSTVGPNINVDGTKQPSVQGQTWVDPRNQVRPLGGQGMESQTPQGDMGRVGQYLERPADLYPSAQVPDQSVTLRGEKIQDEPEPIDYQAELRERARVRGYLTGPETKEAEPAPEAAPAATERPPLPPLNVLDPQTNRAKLAQFRKKIEKGARPQVHLQQDDQGNLQAYVTTGMRGEGNPAFRLDVTPDELRGLQANEAGWQNIVDVTSAHEAEVKAGRSRWEDSPLTPDHWDKHMAAYDDLVKEPVARLFAGKPATTADTFDARLAKAQGEIREGIKQQRAEKRQAKAAEPTAAPRRGEVGGKLAAGEVVTTATGRSTTPFPALKWDTKRKAINTTKAVDRWLMQNAHDEAAARGDDFARRQFEQNLDKPQQADKDLAEEYLFGTAPIAPQPRPLLKPLVPEAKPEDEQQRLQARHAKIDHALDQLEDRKIAWLHTRAGLPGQGKLIQQKRDDLKQLHPDDAERLLKLDADKPAAAAATREKTKAQQQGGRIQRTVQQLGQVGDRFTVSKDIGYVSAGRTYTIEQIDTGGTAHVRSEQGRTTLSRFELTTALRDGATVEKLGPVEVDKGETQDKARPAAEKPASEPAEAAYGESNRLVSKDRAAEIRAKLKAKLNGSQLNSGLDPEILSLGAELAVFHIEAGVRKFAAFARTMAQDLDMPLEKVRPFLRSWYNSARDMLEDHGESIEGMDSPDQVRAELAKLTNEPAPIGATQAIVTPAGRELLVRPKVVEAADLVASNDDGGAVNPAYPQHLQPRDRTRASSEMQVNDLAANMNPRLLGMTSSATDGAPIVGPDSVVESGNGRTMAIRRAYERNLPSAREYRAWLKEQGHQVDGMTAPVLVRERVTPLDDEQRRAFTVEANERTTLTQSASERALQDARELDGIIDQYRGGDVGAAQNQGFVRAFMRDVVAKADQGAMMDADGMLSQDGRRRMEAALMAAAYEDPGVVAELFENSDNDIRSIGGALLDVSGSWAQMRQEARAGQIPAGMDITPNVLEAVNLVRKARASGRPVAELVNQNDIFAGDMDPITQTVVSWFYRGDNFNRARGRDKVADILRDFLTTARAAQPGDNMFGEPEPTGAQVAGATRDKIQRDEQRSEQQAGQQGGLFGASGFGGGVRTRGDARPGSEPGQARPAAETGGVDVPGNARTLEPDSRLAEAGESVAKNVAPNAQGADAGAAAEHGAGARGERRAGQRDNQLPDDGAAAGRARSDKPVHQRDGKLEPTPGAARGADGAGSRSDRPAGSPVERQRERALAQDADTARAELERRKAAQRKVNDSVPTTRQADPDEIARALPLLLEPQRDDVLKAETRFQSGNGMLFTNGTGTGKTASGLGVAKRFANAGRDNILVVVPSDKIASDWVNFGAMLGMDLTQLASTDDNGRSGPIVTTYANFGANRALAKRDWDLVIPDEAHYLSSAQDGERTDALSTLRALTGHHDGFYRWIRDRYSREYDALQLAQSALPEPEARQSMTPAAIAKLEQAVDKAKAKWDAIEQREAPKWRERWERQQDLPKAVFLSATPFAYVKNVDWAEGYLFHYADPREQFGSTEQMRGYSYNSGDSREKFFMQHFGYRMRYNKLTAPEAGVNLELLEQNFNQHLQDTGALSGRRLDVPHDYDRKFVLIDAGIGKKIDEAFAYLNDESRAATERGDEQADLYRDVENATRKAFDYQSRMYLLEALKARAVVPLIKQHQALGRKVVVFHDYNKGGGFNPFERVVQQITSGQPARDLARQLFAARPDLFKLDFSGLYSPIETLGAAFPNALFFNGTVPKAERRANADRFNDEAGEHRLIVLQSDAGREGVSLHDTTGKYPRVLINLGLPVRPVAATQIEGRTYRTGQASDAAFRYLTTGTSWEAGAFASKIAQRAATAENLALGAEARGLKQAFIDAYENANDDAPSAEDGRGGKEYDRAMSAGSLLSGFNKAKTYYYAQQKNTKRRDQREGDDYYATAEPVGFKMVEWSGIQDGEKGLEPSAGHGAIARFFPPLADVTMVEPSYSLAERAALANGGARIETMRFEDFPLVNKAHAIVMNPPYGRGGKTAMEHVAKAARHLYQGGRIVALIPRGGMVERYLSDFMASDAAKGLQEVATVALPGLAFERAGTSVNTQILVLEKTDRPLAPRSIDLSGAENISELFDRLEHLEMPDRGPVEAAPAEAPAAPAPAAADVPKTSPFRKAEKNGQKSGHITLNGQQYPVVEHITKGGKGKVIHGIIRPDLTQAQAKEIDAYTFKKDGGWFIRTEHLTDTTGTRYRLDPLPDFNVPPTRLKREVFGSVARKLAAGTGVDVLVVDSVGDLPKMLRDRVAADGTRNTVRGIWHNGQVFLIANRLRDVDHAAQIALHEIFGHAGVRAALGDRLNPVLDQIHRSLSASRIQELASLYAGQLEGMAPADARRLIADEHLAQLAESNPRNGFVARAIAAIRKFAREVLGLPVRWSQAEMVDLLAQGRRALLERRAGAGTRYSQGEDVAAQEFERTAQQLGGEAAYQEARAAGRTKLDYRQWVQVRTPSFKAWFGEWEHGPQEVYGRGSGAVSERAQGREDAGRLRGGNRAAAPADAGRTSDVRRVGRPETGVPRLDPETGEPAVFYHGTADRFTAFDTDHPNRKDAGWLGRGVYLTNNEPLARSYSRTKRGAGEPQVMALFANLRNPFIASLQVKGHLQRASQAQVDAFTEQLRAAGYDGVALPFHGGGLEVMVLDPANVKSATDNAGSFDPTTSDIRYSVGAQPGDKADLEALRKLGLVPEEAKGVLARLREFVQGDMRAKLDALKARANEGIFDGLAGIRQAEEAVGITGERRGYVSARLATGLPDVMHGLLHYGAPQWKDGVLQHKAGTRGLLDVLGDLGGENLTDWLAWVGAKRAELLAAEGRENNLEPAEIQRLLAKAGARAPLFQQVYAEYAKLNTAMLDVAEQAGLISAKQRAGWMSDYYIPFYRMPEDEDGTNTLLAPTSKAGLSHQSAAIKRLTGGDIPTADLLSNMLTNWSKRLDASLKNRALLDVVDNLKDTPYLEAEPNPGAPARAQGVGFARDRDDIIRVQRDGKDEYFKVKDKALLRAVTAMSGMYFKDPVTTLGRKFKRLLTTGVTAAPDFMLRNFLRDSAQAWITNPDKFKLGIDSVKGLRAAFAQDADYRDLMFGGASFAGGYANAADPEAAAESIRRALKAKGLTKAQQDSYLASLASTSGKLGDALAKGWEKYREIGERIENANRLATYKRALEAGKSRRLAAFEAKDLMDFSMRGNFVALQWLTDVVPFLNARLQGLGKLGRSYRDDKGQVLRQVVMKAGMLAAFSLILAALNGDDDRYKALQEWDKDANWHFWFSADQVEPIRIPKPFELGLLFGTLPERLLNVTAGNQDGAQLQGAIARGVVSTLAFNPIPQFYMPIRDIQANKSLYFGTPIESLADEGKLSAARYDSRTSEVAKALGQLTGPTLGLSPKQIDYLVKGYTGTLGAYVLGASDLVAQQFQDGERPALTARQVPLLSVIYKGSSPGSTQYQTDLYDMVHEADEIYRTARAWRQEGRVDDARELLEDNRDKLRQRGALGLARQQLGNIRAQREQVMRSNTMDAEQKRERLDELQRRENRIAERVTTRAREAFK